MAGKAFHIIISKDKVLLNWGNQQGVPYRIASGLEKDRLIARILHKILNLRLSGENSGVLGKDEFRMLGATLFKLLFNDEALKVHFSTFYREALGSPDERYRLILEFEKEAAEMAMLPWEYLFYEEDEVQEAFLAAHPKKCIDVIRKLPFKGNWLELDKTAQEIEAPLKVLIIAANPDTALCMDNLSQAVDYFEGLEKRFPEKIDVEIILQPEVDLFEQQLSQVTQNGTFFPHLIHFIGRGRMDGENGQLCFVKRNAAGKYDENWISDDTFAGFFEEWRRLPHMVVLDVCDSTPIGNYGEDKGVAIRLVKKGVPFVLALQNPAPEWMTQTLIEKLYDSFLDGADIAAALTESRFFLARKLMDAEGRKYDNYEHKIFGSPVLFSSILQTFALAKPANQEQSQSQNTTYKICPNHPQIKFIPNETRCSLCGSQLILPSELGERKTETPRSAEVNVRSEAGILESSLSTSTGRVSAESYTRSAAPTTETLSTAGRTTSTTLNTENAKLSFIKRYFKKMISNELENAFKELEAIIAMDAQDVSNKFYTLLGDFNNLNKEYQAGILDDKDSTVRFSKVRFLLLEFVDGLKVLDIEGTYFANFKTE